MKDVYAIDEGKNGGEKQRTRWVRVGAAFENKDVMRSHGLCGAARRQSVFTAAAARIYSA